MWKRYITIRNDIETWAAFCTLEGVGDPVCEERSNTPFPHMLWYGVKIFIRLSRGQPLHNAFSSTYEISTYPSLVSLCKGRLRLFHLEMRSLEVNVEHDVTETALPATQLQKSEIQRKRRSAARIGGVMELFVP